MFCPVCKYEYRRGFTHCNDCDVDLVETLPQEDGPGSLKAMESPALLWSGLNDGTVFKEIIMALDAAKILYNREELDARLVYGGELTQLEIWVPAAQFAEAEKLRDEVLASAGGGDDASSAAASDGTFELPDEGDADDLPASNDVAEELFREDATCEVWAGADANMSQILKSCLAEVGIGCYVEGEESENFSVRVRPENEDRARKVVREVVDGVPPQ